MARQKGILKIDGMIEDFSFYHTKRGSFVRRKGGVSAERIASDPAFIRTRENGREFASTASAGKTLRNALRPMLLNATDDQTVSRLAKVMSEIKKLDGTSVRGERNVGLGIADPKARLLLKGFNFNENALLSVILKKKYNVLAANGEISISDLKPIDDLIFPVGATHVSFKGGWARIDFTSGEAELFESNVVSLKLDNTVGIVKLTPSAQPTGSGTDLFLLRLEFYQEMNGVQYSLKDSSSNALGIVEVI